jgi:hypothetical protein
MDGETSLGTNHSALLYVALAAALAVSLWLGAPWGTAVQGAVFVVLTGVPLGEWLVRAMRRKQPPSAPPMLEGRNMQIRVWDCLVELPPDRIARETFLAELLAEGIGPRSSLDDIGWLLGAEGNDNGCDSPEMYAAVLVVSVAKQADVAAVLNEGIGPETKRAILDEIGDENARWIHDWLKNLVTCHAFWSTVAVFTKILASSGSPGSAWVKCDDIEFLKNDRPELWAALSSAGSPSCHVDGAGIMSHYLAEEAAGQRVEHPYLECGVSALKTMLDV